MSVKDLIIEAGERYASLTPVELNREAHVFGRMYETCYYAAAKDVIKASNFLKSNQAPALKIAKALYTMVAPFSATVAENAKELRKTFEEEYDNKNNVEPVMADDETTEEPAQVTPKQAVTTADLAAGTVRRGVILSRTQHEGL